MKENIKKYIIYILSVIVIVAGVICTALLGFNYGTNYSEAEKITIYIGTEYNMEDIKQMATEIFGRGNIIYQEIELFKDTASITVKSATEEQRDILNTKIKEKYGLEDETVISSTTVPHQMLRDIVKPYIKPLILTTVAIWIFMGIALIVTKADNIIVKLIMAFVNLVLAEAVYVSIFAITRIPINEFFIIGILAIYIIAIVNSFKFKINITKEDKKKA